MESDRVKYLVDEFSKVLEAEIDKAVSRIDEELPPLKVFVPPDQKLDREAREHYQVVASGGMWILERLLGSGNWLASVNDDFSEVTLRRQDNINALPSKSNADGG